MQKKNIAVIAGGDSSEIVISYKSAAQVHACLDRSKYEVFNLTISGRQWLAEGMYSVDKNDFSFTDSQGKKTQFDYALVMIHGTPGENGILQGYFDLMGIPYSCCDVRASALTFDKSLCKRALNGSPGIHLAREIIIQRGQSFDPAQIAQELGLPFFIKPNASGSSFGVTKIKHIQDIEKAITEALKEGSTVMAEEFIDGIEVSQGVMIVGGKEYVLPITELVSKNEFFDFQAKYTPGMTDEITPARIPEHIAQELNQSTLAAYKTLGLKGVVRVDYIIKGDIPYFIEINATPGMSSASIVPQQWAQMGLTMGQAFDIIISDSFI